MRRRRRRAVLRPKYFFCFARRLPSGEPGAGRSFVSPGDSPSGSRAPGVGVRHLTIIDRHAVYRFGDFCYDCARWRVRVGSPGSLARTSLRNRVFSAHSGLKMATAGVFIAIYQCVGCHAGRGNNREFCGQISERSGGNRVPLTQNRECGGLVVALGMSWSWRWVSIRPTVGFEPIASEFAFRAATGRRLGLSRRTAVVGRCRG